MTLSIRVPRTAKIHGTPSNESGTLRALELQCPVQEAWCFRLRLPFLNRLRLRIVYPNRTKPPTPKRAETLHMLLSESLLDFSE